MEKVNKNIKKTKFYPNGIVSQNDITFEPKAPLKKEPKAEIKAELMSEWKNQQQCIKAEIAQFDAGPRAIIKEIANMRDELRKEITDTEEILKTTISDTKFDLMKPLNDYAKKVANLKKWSSIFMSF